MYILDTSHRKIEIPPEDKPQYQLTMILSMTTDKAIINYAKIKNKTPKDNTFKCNVFKITNPRK